MQALAEYIVRRKDPFFVQQAYDQIATRRAYDPEELGPTFFTVDQKYYCRRTDFEVGLDYKP